jgi:hypothetical protein
MTDLKNTIEADIQRYARLLKMYESGELETARVEGREALIDSSSEVHRHLQNVIRELRALLRDG